MRTHALLLLLLLPMIMSGVSDASFVLKLRKLIASDPNDNKTKDPNPVGDGPVSPVPQPQPLPKVANANDGHNNSVPPPNVPPPPPPPPTKDGAGGDKDQKQGKLKNETCEGVNTCTDDGNMLACILITDPKYLVVLLQNRGDDIIKVKLRLDFENLGDVEVDKSKTEKINITRSSSESTQLTLNAGKEDCVLHLVHIPEDNFVFHLPSYDKVLTPVNGAYFLILMVLMFGATWVCCACRKKRQDEIPYQELEMALPETASAANVGSAEGWDQDWDDDWDDNVAVKSPAPLAASISANGLTSRSSNKDGWENTWDD
ncbi:uncharacterized protein [Phaseolus vulgaris]|uniref:uncharacterized protein isoform X2 n=1 Tax=Phaseolus vulgaris TaxID=3885 RepID=UPI0035C99B01